MGKAKPLTAWSADFETTTHPADCRVWAWGLAPISEEGEFEWGTDIESFIDRISQLGNAHYYFHNLAFDGSFIVDYLLKHGYRHIQGRTKQPGTFTSLISRTGKWYSVTVILDNGVRVEFRDSLKKLPMSVAAVAKTFRLPESKGELDYHANRPVGYVPTAEELDYLRRDVDIVARAMRVTLASGMTSLTVGADSLKEYKRVITPKAFERAFPVLAGTVDDDIRAAYRGGWTYANPETQGRLVGHGSVYDVNSLYPSVMYSEPMPYGEPVFFEGPPKPDDEYPLYVVALTFTAKLKPGKLPLIQVKRNPFFRGTEYLTEVSEPVTLSVTSIDLEMWQDHYDMNVLAWEGGWRFKAAQGAFNNYIDKWMKVKAESKGGARFIAKLHLNSLYGKFATNPDVTPKVPVLDGDTVKLILGETEERNPVYTPVGVFITAYARRVTIRACQANYGRFLYADTDSMHLRGFDPPEGVRVHPSELGAWAHESDFGRAVFVRPKCYGEEKVSAAGVETEIHVAGLPATVCDTLTLDQLKPGLTVTGKLVPKRVPGGTVLTETEFTIA